MKQCRDIFSAQQQIAAWRQAGETLALVPTMGNLHAGHLSLIQLAKQHASKVMVSIFVNPLQFAPHEDYTEYPRTLAKDTELLIAEGIDLLFSPDREMIYTDNTMTQIVLPGLQELLCGVSRPHFFSGVATVVAKLFNLLQPHKAVFGEKDYQQLLIIQRMVNELNFPIEILAAPIVRAKDGVALSSRNSYLTTAQRQLAPRLYQILTQIKQQVFQGNSAHLRLTQQAMQQLTQLGFAVDYLKVCDQSNLQDPTANTLTLRVLAAVYLGKVRLIDNLTLPITVNQ